MILPTLFRSVLAPAALVLCAASLLAQDYPKAAVEALNAGSALQKAGKLEEAVAKYDAAIKAAPKMYQAFGNRASARLSEAIKARDAAQELRDAIVPGASAEVTAGLNAQIEPLAAKAAEAFKLAIADYDEAIKHSPKTNTLIFDRGNAWALSGESDKAIADFEELLKREPKSTKALYGRGLAFFDRAKAARDRLVKVEKRTIDSAILIVKDDFDKAIADFTACIEIEKDFGGAYQNRAACNALILEFELAITDYNKAIELEPKNKRAFRGRSEIYRALAENYKATGETAKAAENKALYEKDLAKFEELDKAERAAQEAAAAAAATATATATPASSAPPAPAPKGAPSAAPKPTAPPKK